MNHELEDTEVTVVTTGQGTRLEQFLVRADELATQARSLVIVDDQTKDAALLIISKLQGDEDELDAERKAQTDPLRKQIELITSPYTKAKEFLKSIREEMRTRLSRYTTQRAAELAAQQQRAIGEAEQRRAEEQRKADEARKAAEAERAKGNELAALKLETRAEKAELSASLVAPEVIQQPAKTVAFEDGSKVTMRTVKDWTYQNGSQRGKEYYRNDPRFQSIPDECFVLDEAKVGKLIRAGATIPGITVYEKASTITRKGAA